MHTTPELSIHPKAQRVMKKPVTVTVRFATTSGFLETLEGDVAYEQGDALATAASGESWPVPRDSFLRSYTPAPPTRIGEDGAYTKFTVAVWAIQQVEAFSSTLANGSVLHGTPGDWLVEYGENNFGVVAAHIFEQTYDILN